MISLESQHADAQAMFESADALPCAFKRADVPDVETLVLLNRVWDTLPEGSKMAKVGASKLMATLLMAKVGTPQHGDLLLIGTVTYKVHALTYQDGVTCEAVITVQDMGN